MAKGSIRLGTQTILVSDTQGGMGAPAGQFRGSSRRFMTLLLSKRSTSPAYVALVARMGPFGLTANNSHQSSN